MPLRAIYPIGRFFFFSPAAFGLLLYNTYRTPFSFSFSHVLNHILDTFGVEGKQWETLSPLP